MRGPVGRWRFAGPRAEEPSWGLLPVCIRTFGAAIPGRDSDRAQPGHSERAGCWGARAGRSCRGDGRRVGFGVSGVSRFRSRRVFGPCPGHDVVGFGVVDGADVVAAAIPGLFHQDGGGFPYLGVAADVGMPNDWLLRIPARIQLYPEGGKMLVEDRYQRGSYGMLFETNPVDLRELIAKAKSGLIQLPDFQRGWVWDDERIAALLVTVRAATRSGS